MAADRRWGTAVPDGVEQFAGILDDGADSDLDDPFSPFTRPARSPSRRRADPVTADAGPGGQPGGEPDRGPDLTGSATRTAGTGQDTARADPDATGPGEVGSPAPTDTTPAHPRPVRARRPGRNQATGQAPAAPVPDLTQPPGPGPDRPSREVDTRDPVAPGRAGALDPGTRPARRGRSRSTRPVVLQMPVPVVDATNDFARAHNVTKAEVVLHAVEASRDLFDGMFPAGLPTGDGPSLFEPRQVRRVRRVGEPLAQMQVQLIPSELAVLDGLAEQYRAPSRSQLVGKCLRAFLGLPDAPK